MAFEDGAVLGEVLSRLPNDPSTSKTSPEFVARKRHALAVFEKCRKQRTQMVVKRGNTQQYLYHLHDGPEQEERDSKMRMVPTPEGECLAWRDPGLAPKLLGYDHVADVSRLRGGTNHREETILTACLQVNEIWHTVKIQPTEVESEPDQVASRL
jgi:salicylate hydroxylase